MNNSTFNRIKVWYAGGTNKRLVGSLFQHERTILFEYDATFIDTAIELSPFKLPLSSNVTPCNERIFGGLFGVFNDSIPDGWARLLLDRALLKQGIHPTNLSPLDRLSYVGSHGMGALMYEPEVSSNATAEKYDLDDLAAHALRVYASDDADFVDELLSQSGSSGGARPKVIIQRSPEPGDEWIVKFRASGDQMDSGALEYAYHTMAHAAGLRLSPAMLFPSRTGSGYFGTKRFDRIGATRVHMHTMSGLLHASHQIPSLDYETIMKATLWLTKNNEECVVQFRAAVFNVLAHNRDDHAKNFSFLMEATGTWTVSPAYDLTFSSGPGGEHATSFLGEGQIITRSHLVALGTKMGMPIAQVRAIIDEVAHAVAQWRTFAAAAGASKVSTTAIAAALEKTLARVK